MKTLSNLFLILILLTAVNFTQNLSPIPTKEGTRFFYKSDQAFEVFSVAVAGQFNGWDAKANSMSLNDTTNIWSTTINIQTGIEYHYKFVINDTLWITDPNAPNVTEDEWRNGIIIAQKFGAPFVISIHPAQSRRVEEIPELKILLGSNEAKIDPNSISLLFNDAPINFSFDEKKSVVTAILDSSITDGEHKIFIAFADKKGNVNERFISKFFLDRFIHDIVTPTFYDSAVMYEIFIRTFYDSDKDGIGDFNGVTKKLDYINILGANVIWLMPWNESTTVHGYNVVDYYSIEKDYGTFDDYFNFLKEAKNRNMRVIMDFVINHSDSTHPFFLDAYKNPKSKYSDWYQFTNDENSNWRHFGIERKMPKFDFENPEVQKYFLDNAKFWLDPNGDGDFSDGVDGFRCDAAKEVPHRFWSVFRKEMKAINPEVLLLGEVWDNAFFLIPFFKEEFDMLFDYPLFYAMEDYFGERNLSEIPERINEMNEIYPSGYQMTRFLSNHDNHRAISFFDYDIKKLKQANFLLFTLPGMPMIYYGDEIGKSGKLPPENVRQNMNWNEAQKQIDNEESLFNFHKNLIELRKQFPTLWKRDDSKNNSLEFLNDKNEKILAYLRFDEESQFIILVNNSGETVKGNLELFFQNNIIELKNRIEITYTNVDQSSLNANAFNFLEQKNGEVKIKNVILDNGDFYLLRLK